MNTPFWLALLGILLALIVVIALVLGRKNPDRAPREPEARWLWWAMLGVCGVSVLAWDWTLSFWILVLGEGTLTIMAVVMHERRRRVKAEIPAQGGARTLRSDTSQRLR